jgi:class 3 adenylate cyclase
VSKVLPLSSNGAKAEKGKQLHGGTEHDGPRRASLDEKTFTTKYGQMCARTEEWFRSRNEATLSGAISFVPWILQQSYKEGDMDKENIVIHRGDGAVVFSDASGFTALTERLALKPNGAELLSQCLTSFFTPLIDIICAYRGDVIKFSGDALTIYFPAVDDTQHPRYRSVVPPHGTYGLPDLGPMTTAVLRSSACCIEIHKRLHMFDTGVDGVTLCLHIGVGCGNVTILQVGGVVPPETKTPRFEYVIAGPPLEQISIAEPLAKNGETCISPQAWAYVHDSVQEGRILEDQPDFHILVQMDETKYTYPTVRNAAMERDSRNEMRFALAELPVLRRYIPSSVFKQIEGGTLTYVNEMRNIATIFISGSGVDVSTDEGSRVAQDLMSGVQRCCYAHEGTLNKYLVDDKGMLFLLVYGLPPMVHTDDPSRAVLACLDIVEVFRRLGLVGRCGVTTGRNYCGVVGSAKRMEYTVLGDTVNLAARLMANAGPLSVLVDEATHKLSKSHVKYTALEPIKVKGKSNLIPIFEPTPLPAREAIGLRLDGSIGFPWTAHSSFLGGRSILPEISNWDAMLQMNNLLQESTKAGGPGGNNNSLLFTGGGVLVLGGDIGLGKTEICEYAVTEAHKRFNYIPIFGSAGNRPGEKFRPIHELLRSLVLAFRHIDSTLPAEEKTALISLLRAFGETGEMSEFASELRPDLGQPESACSSHEVGSSTEIRFCKKGVELVVKLARKLIKERAVCCAVSLKTGHNIFESSERQEDELIFWELVTTISRLIKEGTQNPFVLVVVVKGGVEDVADDVKELVQKDCCIRMRPLPDDSILEYMGKHIQLAQQKVPESLHRYVAKITQGNALFIRETIDQLLHYGHISIVMDSRTGLPESMKCTTDFESINIADWGNTSMVGGTICLLESLDPLQAAVVKMATVFRGVFTVADLAASSCSRWAGATYFDAVRVFYSVSMLVGRGIIDRADDDVDKEFLGNADNVIECFRLNNVLIRKVGNSMVLEAQKKAVKRQALMDRVLAKELPQKMIEVRRKKAIQHIPWYYQIDQAEGKNRTGYT